MCKVEILTDDIDIRICENKAVVSIDLENLRFIVEKYKEELSDEIAQAYKSIYMEV